MVTAPTNCCAWNGHFTEFSWKLASFLLVFTVMMPWV